MVRVRVRVRESSRGREDLRKSFERPSAPRSASKARSARPSDSHIETATKRSSSCHMAGVGARESTCRSSGGSDGWLSFQRVVTGGNTPAKLDRPFSEAAAASDGAVRSGERCWSFCRCSSCSAEIVRLSSSSSFEKTK